MLYSQYIVTSFFYPPFNRTVRVYVYLPKEYTSTTESYPVFYMHDGHNLFDNRSASFGTSWDICALLEADDTLPKTIVVGVDSSIDGLVRADEYSPFITNQYQNNPDIARTLGGKGDIYLDLLVRKIKPMIDTTYRTLPDAMHTALGGSSLGGFITTYAATKYSHIFSRFAALSNAYFFELDAIKQAVLQADFSNVHKFYMDIGTQENSALNGSPLLYLETNKEMACILKEKLPSKAFLFKIIEGGTHNESAWHSRFAMIYKWIWKEEKKHG